MIFAKHFSARTTPALSKNAKKWCRLIWAVTDLHAKPVLVPELHLHETLVLMHKFFQQT